MVWRLLITIISVAVIMFQCTAENRDKIRQQLEDAFISLGNKDFLEYITNAVDVDCQPVTVNGQTVYGNLSERDATLEGSYYDCYTMNGVDHRNVTISLYSPDFDTYLYVRFPDGKIEENDDFGGARQSQVLIEELYDGEIYIKATSYNPGEVGNYTLNVFDITNGSESYDSGSKINPNNIQSNSNNAQTPQYLSIGQSLIGTLRNTDSILQSGEYYDEYNIELNTGQTITVDLTSDEIDTYLIIFDPEGDQVDNDDYDPDISTNSRLVYHPSVSGTYDITVTSYDVGEIGEYSLVISEGEIETAELDIALNAEYTINPGERLRETLDQNDNTLPSGEFYDTFAFTANEGDRLIIDMISEDFDTYLILHYPDGLQEDYDDYMDSSNSHIEIRLNQTGEYYLLTTSYSTGETGGYSLTMDYGTSSSTTTVEASPPITPPPSTQGDYVRISEALNRGDDTLSSGEYYDQYTFLGNRGDRINISLSSDDFDTYLMLIAPSGQQEENDDISDDNRNSALEITLDETGEYELYVTSYEEGETGAYDLTYPSSESSSTDPNSPQSDPQNTENNGTTYITSQPGGNAESIQGRLSPGDETLSSGEYYDAYEVDVQQNAVLTIDLTSNEFDTYVIYFDPSGNQEDNDDGNASSNSTDSHLDVVAREDGVAQIYVTSYEAGETGLYNLSWTVSSRSGYNPEGVVAINNNNNNNATSPGSNNHHQQDGSRQYYGIFCGISDYPGSGDDLPLCANDAVKIQQQLVSSGFMAEDNYILLLNNQATTRNVRQAFEEMGNRVDGDDVFIFFYSGHGVQDDRQNVNCREADLKDEYILLYDTEFSDDEMARMFDYIEADVAILCLDACFSGGFSKDVIVKPNRMGLFSSEEDLTSSIADKFNAGGYLSYFFRQGLLGNADTDPRDGMVTAGELCHYLIMEFAENVSRDVGAENMAGTSTAGYQHLVIDRGGVGIDDILFRL